MKLAKATECRQFGRVSSLRNFFRWLKARKAKAGEEGATLVEMALVTSLLFLFVIGIIQVCLALYSYNYICQAARESTRYAVVRGMDSCLNSNTSPQMPNCNLLPTSVTSDQSNPLYTYVQNLGYPGINTSNLHVAPTWWIASSTGASGAASHFTWATQCTGATDAGGVPCNNPRNAVQVVVTYNYPLNIPFWKNATIPMSATSWMVICA
jgi:Flp pilus assembly protein TadG